VQYVNDEMKLKLITYHELIHGNQSQYVGNPEWVEPASACVMSIDCSGGNNLAPPTCTHVHPGVPVFHDPEDVNRWEELQAQGKQADQIIEQIVNEDCKGQPLLPKEWLEMNGFSGDPEAPELQCDPTPPPGGSKSGKQTKTSKSVQTQN
jgi:hypothetical protein